MAENMSEFLQLHRLARLYHDWFDRLPEPVRKDVIAHGRSMRVRKGQRVFSRGDDPGGVFIILTGTFRIAGTTRDGREAILDFFGPGAWLGEVSFFDDLPRLHDVDALEDGTLLHITAASMEELLLRHPEFSRALTRLVAFRLRILLTAFETYSLLTLEGRLASRLLMLANLYGRQGEHGIEINVHLSQEILGKLLGASRQRVSQILSAWQRQDRIRLDRYGRIGVPDLARLEDLLPG